METKIETLTFALIILFPLNMIASTYSIEAVNSRDTLSHEVLDMYNEIILKPEVIYGDIAYIDIETLVHADTLFFYFDNKQITLNDVYRNSNDNYSYIHYVSTDLETHAFFSIYENYIIQADLRTSSEKYHITSIAKTQVAIVKYESETLNEPEYNLISYNNNSDNESNTDVESIVPNSTPIIRVLFLYTTSSLSMMSYPYNENMKIEAYRYINEANESFINSNINVHLELAYLGQSNYNESSYSWDDILNHFSTQNDGHIDEVHALRDKYDADICVLMVNKSVGICGEARTIKANANTAFSIIWPCYYNCGWRFSAIHEIGHLIGCRHNRTMDNSSSPYVYGHGYINCNIVSPAASWCTIMSYESSCSANPNRILYWSNPDIYYNGIATGTTTYENNARVWNERAGTVSEFRTKENSINITTTNINTNALYESYEASTNVLVGSGYEVQSGQVVDIAAGTEIRITANTHIKSGSKFRASIRNNADDSNYPQFITQKEITISDSALNSKSAISINIINHHLIIHSPQTIQSIRIYNITGQCVMQTWQTDIDVSSLSAGVYIVVATTSDGISQQSKFIHL